MQRTSISNLAFLKNVHRYDDLFERFTGIPAVVVAGGPSLDRNVHLLNELGNKALILAVDTVSKKLHSLDIKPHFIFTIDSKEYIYRKVEGSGFEDIPLVHAFLACSQILQKHRGRQIIGGDHDEYFLETLKKVGTSLDSMMTGGSVACNAFDVAVRAGCDPIIFIGQDLAYTNDETHASGAAFGRKF